MKNVLKTCLVLLTLVLTPMAVMAEDFPTQPIKLIIAFKAGGGADIQNRLLGKFMQEELGQPVLVINKPGGSGGVAAMEIMNAKPDGYTIGALSSSTLTFNTARRKLQFGIDSFNHLGAIASFPYAAVTKADAPYNTIKEAVEYAKENGKTLKYASLTAADKMIMDRVAKSEGEKFIAVPVKGGAAMIPQVLGDHVDFGMSGGLHTPHVKAGKMKVLAATGTSRSVHAPDVLTLQEQGFDEALNMFTFICAPKDIPAPILDKLTKAIAKVTAMDEYKDTLQNKYFFDPLDWDPKKTVSILTEEHSQFVKMLGK